MKKLVKSLLSKLGMQITRNTNKDPFLEQLSLVGNQKEINIFDVGSHVGETLVKYSKFSLILLFTVLNHFLFLTIS